MTRVPPIIDSQSWLKGHYWHRQQVCAEASVHRYMNNIDTSIFFTSYTRYLLRITYHHCTHTLQLFHKKEPFPYYKEEIDPQKNKDM